MYIDGINPERLADEYGTPLYIYDADTIRTRFRQLRQSLTIPNTRIYYAAKANSNIAILRIFRDEGAYINAVSPGEIFLAMEAGFNSNQIMFTGDNLPVEDMRYAINKGVLVNLDSLSQLVTYSKLNPAAPISLRINPGIEAGFHDHVITAGPRSKFGIDPVELKKAQEIANTAQLEIIGLHMHIGSGILHSDPLLKAAETLLNLAKGFEDLKFINFGGGLGIPYKSNEKPINVETYCQSLVERFVYWTEKYGKQLILAIEPGKFLVAESGVLLTRVTAIKAKGHKKLIGVDTGFNHLLRPALYNAYHEIIPVNKTRTSPEWTADIVGYICENSDFLARDRPFSAVNEGDLLAVMNVGAYGFSMASNYNSRLLPAEVLISNRKIRLIRRRQALEDLLRDQQG